MDDEKLIGFDTDLVICDENAEKAKAIYCC